MNAPRIALVAAVARNGVIGHDNQLLWRLPEDLAYFRRTTLGAPVLMGRKTWDSLPARFRPLPGRRNLVLTRQAGFAEAGAEPVASVAQALEALSARAASATPSPGPASNGGSATAPTLFVIGGEQVYRAALPLADDLLLTELDRDFDGDTRFPDWDRAAFDEVSRERHQAAAPNDFTFSFVAYRRRAQPGTA